MIKIERNYGKHKVSPSIAAGDNISISGNKAILSTVFSFGYGPLEIENIQIGEEDLDDFTETQINRQLRTWL